jgi:hypothetical protein
MSEGMASARILPIRPAVGFAAVSLVAGILAFLTARDANRNQMIHPREGAAQGSVRLTDGQILRMSKAGRERLLELGRI